MGDNFPSPQSHTIPDSTLLAIAQNLATVTVKLDNLRDQVSDQRSTSTKQFDRIDSEVGKVKDEQRSLDKKVDVQRADLIRQYEEIVTSLKATKGMVESLQSPVNKWSIFESRIHGGWWVAATIAVVLSVIFQPFWAHLAQDLFVKH